jgi:UDP-N-acetylglucosamine--N-acetylmuramyl-(pentapeptide) pyrophosphoryl-undecaprenol N-acetylglucosamine transferase
MKEPRFIISGGGTGGHIYPAIAIANELKTRFPNAEILFVGAKDKMEMQKMPQAGYKIEGLWIAGLQRNLTFENALFPIKLIVSLFKSFIIIQNFKPNVVIGTGGFASGAVLKVAAMLGIPTLIQEQNSYPGITNKLLAKKAHSICVAYKNLDAFFPKDKIKFTGNPVRQDLLNVDNKRDEAISYFDLDTTKKTLLVLGGSLGAKRINQLTASNLPFFETHNIQLIWQCGKNYYTEFSKFSNPKVKVLDYIERMDLVYAAADVIISRSGASSVSELCLVGKPTLFIPSPNVAEDHQTKNAKSIVDENGSLLIKEQDLEHSFQTVFNDLLNDENKQKLISQNIKKLAKPNATIDIVAEINKLITKK